MRRYIDTIYDPQMRDQVIGLSDARALKFINLITQTRFNTALSVIKKS